MVTAEPKVHASTKAKTAIVLLQPTNASNSVHIPGPKAPNELKIFLTTPLVAMPRLMIMSCTTLMTRDARNIPKYGSMDRKPFYKFKEEEFNTWNNMVLAYLHFSKKSDGYYLGRVECHYTKSGSPIGSMCELHTVLEKGSM